MCVPRPYTYFLWSHAWYCNWLFVSLPEELNSKLWEGKDHFLALTKSPVPTQCLLQNKPPVSKYSSPSFECLMGSGLIRSSPCLASATDLLPYSCSTHLGYLCSVTTSQNVSAWNVLPLTYPSGKILFNLQKTTKSLTPEHLSSGPVSPSSFKYSLIYAVLVGYVFLLVNLPYFTAPFSQSVFSHWVSTWFEHRAGPEQEARHGNHWSQQGLSEPPCGAVEHTCPFPQCPTWPLPQPLLCHSGGKHGSER